MACGVDLSDEYASNSLRQGGAELLIFDTPSEEHSHECADCLCKKPTIVKGLTQYSYFACINFAVFTSISLPWLALISNKSPIRLSQYLSLPVRGAPRNSTVLQV